LSPTEERFPIARNEQVRREQHEAEAESSFLRMVGEGLRDAKDNMMITEEALDKISAEMERRQAWFEERLKEEPELGQRMEELREEYEKEHPS
jgi:hypothetical protein